MKNEKKFIVYWALFKGCDRQADRMQSFDFGNHPRFSKWLEDARTDCEIKNNVDSMIMTRCKRWTEKS